MKNTKNNGKTKTKKNLTKKGNNKLIPALVVVILFIAMAYAVRVPAAKDNQNVQVMSLKDIRAQIDSDYVKKGLEGMGTSTPAVRDGYSPMLSPRKADKLPDYVYTNAMTLKAYKYASEHPEVLEQIPCYCGCGEHGSEASEGKPHRFLRDCFINDKGVYDNHASFCDVCVGINLKVQSALPSGGA